MVLVLLYLRVILVTIVEEQAAVAELELLRRILHIRIVQAEKQCMKV